jgi:oxygen-dependent protoporphyrinogen oxidase
MSDIEAKPHVVVVGGGISGFAAAERLSRGEGAARVTILEASDSFGGNIRTEHAGGFLIEAGPDVMLSSKPWGVELARQVGLGDEIIGIRPEAKGAFILTERGLRRIPEGISGLVPSDWRPFVGTSLLSPLGKLRVALEYFVRADRSGRDESVESFVVRRLGREMYSRLAQPLLSGISAGDGAHLSISAMFPQLKRMETEHGGLLRGMKAKRAPSSAPNGLPPFVSFRGGMGDLVRATVAALELRPAVELRTGARVGRIGRDPRGGFALDLTNGDGLVADAVIVTTPAYAAAEIVREMDSTLSSMLDQIEYSSTATISLAYPDAAVQRPLNGTGYVVPETRRRPIIACTWSSAKLEGRAPRGHSLFRLFIGGARGAAVVSAPDDELLLLVRAEMREVMGIAAEPELQRITRFKRSMPQYHVGHLDQVRDIQSRASITPLLYLAGGAYGGVGIPDSVHSGELAAQAAARDLAGRGTRVR